MTIGGWVKTGGKSNPGRSTGKDPVHNQPSGKKPVDASHIQIINLPLGCPAALYLRSKWPCQDQCKGGKENDGWKAFQAPEAIPGAEHCQPGSQPGGQAGEGIIGSTVGMNGQMCLAVFQTAERLSGRRPDLIHISMSNDPETACV